MLIHLGTIRSPTKPDYGVGVLDWHYRKANWMIKQPSKILARELNSQRRYPV